MIKIANTENNALRFVLSLFWTNVAMNDIGYMSQPPTM